ncbi:Surfactin synthase thioesterase subunit [Actinokineospora alba]|uniref:Surfactin synthase thioesterase subunit n=1 Tax=Actinokineospora alba TaxID=504798 RepID=A0A1H0H8K2_9PSEU|nr:alpha/beta fold hydrolase [Actinokineospora alba]TDP64993.1 surfactin synthase thioesterase subunit [Actinokineospora alba]SDH51459.1 Surfactin synthase thioesterase subunit [Actinokineospora alba]SDO15384.1 Surfactin synthase thioesterase subunit [Actinokineospora alba]
MPLPTDDLWVRGFHPAPAAAHRLVCLPHAGGAASYYFPLSKALSPDVDVLAVQYPGRQDRAAEPLVDSVHELADRLADVIAPRVDRPLSLFGHSMGAAVAFELASRLQERGITAHRLFASGRRAPSLVREGERVHEADDAGVISAMKRLGGVDTALFDVPELVELILPSVRNDFRAVETYRARSGPPLDTPIVALTGDDDPTTSVEEARGWASHTSVGFSLEVYSGGHFFLNEHMGAVVGRIRVELGVSP